MISSYFILFNTKLNVNLPSYTLEILSLLIVFYIYINEIESFSRVQVQVDLFVRPLKTLVLS